MISINEQIIRVLACPTCKGILVPNRETLFCKKCNRIYPIRDGIIDFLDGEVLDETKSVNCEYHDKEADFYDDIHLHILIENKLFRKIVSRVEGAGKTVLDIGSGTGFVLDNFKKEPIFFALIFFIGCYRELLRSIETK